MTEQIVTPKRGPKLRYMPAIQQVLQEQQGILTDRQIFYRLVSKGILKNRLTNYIQLCKVIKQGRVNGVIPWNRIEDRSKPIYEMRESDDGDPEEYFEDAKSEYESAEDTFRESADSYDLPLWSCQPGYVEVWCEKDALSGVLKRVTDKWHVPLIVCRGYQSIGNIHDRLEIYKSMKELELCGTDDPRVKGVRVAWERKVTVLYFGDFDPRGQNIPDVIKRDFQSLGYELNLVKVALTEQQIAQYQLIPAPCKKADTMAAHWIEKNGDRVYELDALEPSVLLQLVDDSIKEHWSQEAYRTRQKTIEDVKSKLTNLIDEYLGDTLE